MFLDSPTDVADAVARDGLRHGVLQAFLGHLQQTAHFGKDLAHHKGVGTVPVVAFHQHPAVDGHDVPLLQWVVIGNPVDHMVVHGGAERSGEPVVSLEPRLGAVIPDEGFRCLIQPQGGYPGANQLGHFGQGSTDKQRTRSEKLDFGFGANLYPSSGHSDQPAIPLTLVPCRPRSFPDSIRESY